MTTGTTRGFPSYRLLGLGVPLACVAGKYIVCCLSHGVGALWGTGGPSFESHSLDLQQQPPPFAAPALFLPQRVRSCTFLTLLQDVARFMLSNTLLLTTLYRKLDQVQSIVLLFTRAVILCIFPTCSSVEAN